MSMYSCDIMRDHCIKNVCKFIMLCCSLDREIRVAYQGECSTQGALELQAHSQGLHLHRIILKVNKCKTLAPHNRFTLKVHALSRFLQIVLHPSRITFQAATQRLLSLQNHSQGCYTEVFIPTKSFSRFIHRGLHLSSITQGCYTEV